VLQLKLRKAGILILAGDLYHTRDNYKFKRVPRVNTSRADTLASFDRVERIARTLKARVIVQHAPEDFASLPAFPAYLD
jgi:N-acyl homoserine lactone hydrolase